MQLSALAIKALIGFSLGLNANAVKNKNFNDTLKAKKISCEAKNNKNKPVKRTKINAKTPTAQKQISSCGKCGKG